MKMECSRKEIGSNPLVSQGHVHRPVFTHEMGVFWEPIFSFLEHHEKYACSSSPITIINILLSRFIHSWFMPFYAFVHPITYTSIHYDC